MENNEICMFMDVKLSTNDKRPDALKFKTWNKCQVKIEAIKCLPCFLRISLMPSVPPASNENADDDVVDDAPQVEKGLTVAITVPGVSISLAASRTKQHSYGLFWTQTRRNCFIYFALETETSCRRHMKWMKKSIKNLELHRQLFLEQRRNSRGPGCFGVHEPVVPGWTTNINCVPNGAESTLDFGATKTTPSTLGPLPQIPVNYDGNISAWSQRVSRVSDIYEEIYEGSILEPARLSRRLSCTSIASGIYEEMKSTASNFNAIAEEIEMKHPPTPPPLPAQRKRINTFETEQCIGFLGEIPRSNTNPESELAKKKKYKNVLDNIFGSGRSKRAKSVSESHACSAEDVIACDTPKHSRQDQRNAATPPIYENNFIAAKRKKPLKSLVAAHMAESKRNSFSSPDLSKINFLDSFDELQDEYVLLKPCSYSIDLDLSSQSLDESTIQPSKHAEQLSAPAHAHKVKAGSMESLNISQAIPKNFNFSACNTSSINLIGANGAAPPRNPLKNKILLDDLTGYCIMAPIRPKRPSQGNMQQTVPLPSSTESTSSGYSTGSYCSTASSCTNSTEERLSQAAPISTAVALQLRHPPIEKQSIIYENLLTCSVSAANNGKQIMNTPPAVDFSGNLYENLLVVKAAQELEQLPVALSTSTPTESPHTPAQTLGCVAVATEQLEQEQENYYQTPRKSIISVDDKIPSYYPNSCDSIRTRRASQSPLQAAPSATSSEKTPNAIGLRQLVGIKMRRERKENLCISSPQQLNVQQQNSNATSCSTDTGISSKCSKMHKSKKTGAHKISENVYSVTHVHKKGSNNNNNKGKQAAESPGTFSDDMRVQLQQELLQLAMLQNIDFKFDDTKALKVTSNSEAVSVAPQLRMAVAADSPVSAGEHCYQVINETYETAAHLLQKYAQLSPNVTPQRLQPAQHHLQHNQAVNTKRQSPAASKPNSNGGTPATANGGHTALTQSKLEVPLAAGDLQWSGVKKFASLPRFKKIDFSPLKLKIHNVLQRNQQHDF